MLDAYGRLKYFYRRRLKSNRPANPPDDVKDLFKKYRDSTKGRMYIETLSEYLKEHQGMATNDAEKNAPKIIASLNGFMNCHRSSISEKSFFKYLLSEENHPLVEKAFDGNAKLAHYFVYTSHCSYLKQNKTNEHNITAEKLKKTMPFVGSLQKGISGESKSKSVGEPSNKTTTDHRKEHKTFHSSTTAIAKALKNGVRVIELDLSISSKKNDITVSHPRIQPQSSVSLTKCMEIINEKAFETSKYPLMIILVQNFVSDQSNVQFLQDKMINRIKNFNWKHNRCPLKQAFEASSLESLKEKLIILTRQQMNHEPSSINTNDKIDYIYDFDEIPESVGNESFGVENLTENNIELAASTYYTSLTQEKILAVYPNFDPNDITNNFDPLIGWTRGAQMVAINPQNFDKHLWVVQGLFRAHVAQQRNDSKEPTPTGYVKKPNILLRNQIFNPTEWRPVKKILKVKVYLGTGWHLDFSSEDFDDKSPPDFFTAVEIVGVPVDEAREKTVPVMDDWVPVWNQEFEFPLTVPELAMLVIEVKEFDTDRTHDFGGQTCLPVWLIRSGIRSVPLYDKKGDPYKSARLLMRLNIN